MIIGNSPVPEAVDLVLTKIAAADSLGEDDFVATNYSPSPQGQIQSGRMLRKLQSSAQSLCTWWSPLFLLLWISSDLGCVALALLRHLHDAAPQLAGLHHVQVPLVLDSSDFSLLWTVLQGFVDITTMFFLLISLLMLVSMLPSVTSLLVLVTSLHMTRQSL